MTDLLKEIRSLCEQYDVAVEINSYCMIIRKYIESEQGLFKFNRAYNLDTDFLDNIEIEDIFINFMERLENELKMRGLRK